MPHFDPLGHLLGRMSDDQATSHERLRALEPRVTALEQQYALIITWGKRIGLLAILWAGALGINMAPDQKAEAIALVLKSLAR